MIKEQPKLQHVAQGPDGGKETSRAAGPSKPEEVWRDHGPALARALQRLAELEQEGVLEELAGLAVLVKVLKDALTDDMVMGLGRRLERLAGIGTDTTLEALLHRMPTAVRAAETAAAAAPPSSFALLKQLGDPAVRRGLAFFLALAQHIVPDANPNLDS